MPQPSPPSLPLFYSHEYTKVTCQKGPLYLSLILFFKGSSQPLSFFSFSLLLIPTRGTPHHFLLFPTFSHASPDYLTLTYLFPHTSPSFSLLSSLFSFSIQPISLLRKLSTEQNPSASCLQQLGNLDGGVHSPNPWWDLLSKVAQGSTKICRGLICNRWPTWAPQSQNESALFLSYYRLQQLRGLDGGSNGTHSSRVHHPWGRPWVPYQMWGPDLQSDHLVGPTINRSQNWFSTKSSLSL